MAKQKKKNKNDISDYLNILTLYAFSIIIMLFYFAPKFGNLISSILIGLGVVICITTILIISYGIIRKNLIFKLTQ